MYPNINHRFWSHKTKTDKKKMAKEPDLEQSTSNNKKSNSEGIDESHAAYKKKKWNPEQKSQDFTSKKKRESPNRPWKSAGFVAPIETLRIFTNCCWRMPENTQRDLRSPPFQDGSPRNEISQRCDFYFHRLRWRFFFSI